MAVRPDFNQVSLIHKINHRSQISGVPAYDPRCKIPSATVNLTGIKNSDVAGKPAIKKALKDFLKFIGDMPLVGHNVIYFDKPFIEYNLQKSGIGSQLKNIWPDTMELAIFLKPEFKKHKLEFLHEKLSGKPPDQKHRAIGDCRALFEVLMKLKIVRDTEWDKDWLDHVGHIADTEGWAWSRFILDSRSMKLGKTNSYLPIENFIKDLNLEKLKTNKISDNNEKDDEANTKEVTEKCAKLDLEEIKYYFDKDKAHLKKVLGSDKYEYRRQQNEMAVKIAESINQNKHLIVEAPTGCGKSMAYLVPSLIWSLKNSNKQVVVSTYTNALQDQLLEKDFSMLKALFKDAKITVAKGREHYVCLRKAKKFFWECAPDNPLPMENSRFSMKLFSLFLANWIIKSQNDNCDLDRFPYWLKKKAEGFRDREINCDEDSCQKHFCPFYKKCFLQRLKLSTRESNIVIANHSLVFSDSWDDSRSLSVLPKDFKILVIDEAINIEAAATDASTETYSRNEFKELLTEFFDSFRPNKSFLHKIALFLSKKGDEKLLSGCEQIESVVEKAIENNAYLFNILEQQNRNRRLKYNKKEEIFGKFLSDIKDILENIESNSREINNFLNSILEKYDEEKQKSFGQEIKTYGRRLGHYLNFISVLKGFDTKGYIFYKEIFADSDDFSLNFCNKNIGDYLEKKLYQRDLKSIIFTSATLTYNNDFGFIKKIWGVNKIPSQKIDYLKLEYLFNYGKQCVLFFVKGLPRKNYDNAGENNAKYYPATAKFLENLLIANNGSSLVLFTNKEDVKRFGDLVIDKLENHNIPLFSSGKNEDARIFSSNYRTLAEEFRDNTESCLFGTAAFREGIDVPGSSLEIVVIIKMPFRYPDDPILKNRQSIYGGFGGYSLPACIFDLKQAFGRLIRSKTDEGFVFLVDEKLVDFGTDVKNNLSSDLPIRWSSAKDLENIYKMIENSKYKRDRVKQVLEQIKRDDDESMDEVPF